MVSDQQDIMNPPILFENEAVANTKVAGLPCAVRSYLAVSRADGFDPSKEQVILLPGAWQVSSAIERELRRVCPAAAVTFASVEAAMSDPALRVVDGLECAATPETSSTLSPVPIDLALEKAAQALGAGSDQRLAQAGRRIIGQTGKPTDGFVSRLINRPISQFCSFHLLKFAWIRPIHATILASALGLIMAFCLFFGGHLGLMAGAVLFQLASIIDGVDGEIARATFRTSKLGATLDTASDAATNFAFIAGVSANLWMGGNALAGKAGLAGLALLVTGLTLLGTVSLRAGGPLSFDALKHDTQVTSSSILALLAKLTSRDVYALILAILILVGFAAPAMIVFAGLVAIWFLAALTMLGRRFLAPK